MFRHHRIIRGWIVLAAALTVSVAPGAWADPPPLAQAEAAIAAKDRATPAVLPNADERTATVARTTSASSQTAPEARSNPDEQTPASSMPNQRSSSPATIVRVLAPSGFDWGDAGIGAAGGVGLSTLVLAAGLAVSQRRTRRGRDSAAATG